MRMKSRRPLAILLSMILLLALAPSGFAVDLNAPNSVTIEFVPRGSDFAEDLATATIQVDLYLLAPAVLYEEPYQNVDSYTYEVPGAGSPFHTLLDQLTKELNGTDSEEPTAEGTEKPAPTPPTEEAVFQQFESYAQDFAEIVLDSSYTPDPDRYKTATAVAEHTAINVDNLAAGLYLLVIRSKNLTAKVDNENPENAYVKRTEQASNDENDEAKTILTTRVVTENYEYLFRPQLFTLPTKLSDNMQQYNTAYGEWVNSLTIYAKPTREPKISELKIIKQLTSRGPDPVSFVFNVEWEGADKKTVKKVVLISFTDSSSYEKYAVVKDVPIGAEVRVTEVHTGIAYRVTSDNQQEVTIEAMPPIPEGSTSAEIPNVLTFINDHSGPGGGYGLLNRFTVSSGALTGVQYDDSADAEKVTADSES